MVCTDIAHATPVAGLRTLPHSCSVVGCAQGMPLAAGTSTPLRRHGDEMERLPNGYYVAHGRADDTMNLGGIKVMLKMTIFRACKTQAVHCAAACKDSIWMWRDCKRGKPLADGHVKSMTG